MGMIGMSLESRQAVRALQRREESSMALQSATVMLYEKPLNSGASDSKHLHQLTNQNWSDLG